MPKFTKAMLQANRTYKSPDGDVYVTRERLKHWADTFAAMDAAGLAIPMSWGHDDDPEKGVPIKFANRNGRRRLPEETVGYLHSLNLSPDGNSAEIEIDVRGKNNVESVEENLAYVSPVIRDKWQDGDGNVWEDCWGHLDLVQHPVDHRQTPFKRVVDDQPMVACALRMGLDTGKPTTYHLQAEGNEMPEDEKDKDMNEDNPDGQDVVTNEGGRLKKVVEILAKMDVILSDDTNEENFLEHLEQALLTAAAQNGDMNQEAENAGQEREEVEVTAPQFAAMSLERKREKAYMDNQHRDRIAKRLANLLADGRCTPAEYKDKTPALKTVRLSLDDEGNAVPGQLEGWIESREAVPKGTFWDSQTRTRMADLDVVPHPSDVDEALTDEEADRVADEVLGKR